MKEGQFERGAEQLLLQADSAVTLEEAGVHYSLAKLAAYLVDSSSGNSGDKDETTACRSLLNPPTDRVLTSSALKAAMRGLFLVEAQRRLISVKPK